MNFLHCENRHGNLASVISRRSSLISTVRAHLTNSNMRFTLYASKKCAILSLLLPPLSLSLFPSHSLHPSFSFPPHRAGRSLTWRVSRLICRSSANAWPCHRKRAVRSNFRFSPGGIATRKREIARVITAAIHRSLCVHVCIPARITSLFYFFVTFN